ncbi:MAG TPA: HIT domain-containing protein [Bryobacteraceae bacterium]|nr:HIT domain-containing protein [Bryobacteraceae bacterium]
MDYLWSPWRYRYVTQAEPTGGCIFCIKASENKDPENYVVYRGKLNFVLLNLYPYTSGHLMIAPYEHVATMERAPAETLAEMMQLAQRAETNLRTAYRPEGFNIGMNIGASAGAGIAGHIHLHVLPRWTADANFMTTVGETRVLPEELPATYEKLAKLSWQG